MINKAFLHPAVRQRMDIMVRTAREQGFAPVVRSTVRDSGTQRDLWERCQARAWPFPVKEPGCSQHEWGMAFDLVATQGATVANRPVPGRVGIAACAILGLCPQETPGQDLAAAQFAIQLNGRRLGLSTPDSDPIHFSVFPASVWDPHMRSEFGLGCSTCPAAEQFRFERRSGLREFVEFGIRRAGFPFTQESQTAPHP